jgi:hypothetical protein
MDEKERLGRLLAILYAFHAKAVREGILAMDDYLVSMPIEEIAKCLVLAPIAFGHASVDAANVLRKDLINFATCVTPIPGVPRNSDVEALRGRIRAYATAAYAKCLAARSSKPPQLSTEEVVDVMAILLVNGTEPDMAHRALEGFIKFSDATNIESELIKMYARCIRQGRHPERVFNRINSVLSLGFGHIPTPLFHFENGRGVFDELEDPKFLRSIEKKFMRSYAEGGAH